MAARALTPAQFRAHVWRFYHAHGRHDLPWRKTRSLYRILVSEVMLQQTQVDRAVSYYRRFMRAYPDAQKLALAPLRDVIILWQGLGYNRRAKFLHEAARRLADAREFGSRNLIEELEQLPGVGAYTARAVAAFARNEDTIVIETNIRTAVIHHFFPTHQTVTDRAIGQILDAVLPHGRAREWYSALMDYGASLKRQGVSYNARTRGYAKQVPLKGSVREVRGAILRSLARQELATMTDLSRLFPASRLPMVKQAAAALVKEGMVSRRRGTYRLAGISDEGRRDRAQDRYAHPGKQEKHAIPVNREDRHPHQRRDDIGQRPHGTEDAHR